MRQKFIALTCIVVWFAFQTIGAYSLELQAVNAAEPSKTSASKNKGPDPVLVRAQVLLGRVGCSTGEIDGREGENFRKAVRAFAVHKDLKYGNQLTPELWAALIETSPEPA